MNYDEFKLFVKENVGEYFDSEEQVKDVVIKEIHKNGISFRWTFGDTSKCQYFSGHLS